MTLLLSANDIGLVLGDRLLFRDVNFALGTGDCLLIEGANGCGKTSLLRVIAGLLDPESGDVLWQGHSIREQRQAYCANLVWYGHSSGCKQDLTLIENLRCESALRPGSGADVRAVLKRLDLQALTELPVRSLSAGQQRRVALARLLLADVPLWLLDEPFTNLDRDGQAVVEEIIAEHLATGGVCVMATHRGVELPMPAQRLSLS